MKRMIAVVATVVAGVIAGPVATDSVPAPLRAPAAADDGASGETAPTSYRFLSSPDFMNADVADLRGYAGWRRAYRQTGRKPQNSWNSSYAQLVDTIMDRFRSEEPADVLVAGDLVNGHWGRDTQKTRVFGPVETRQQEVEAVDRAARVYFGSYRRLFTSRGLDVRPAMGDHEYGDNPWGAATRNGPLKLASMNTIRSRFDRTFHQPFGYTVRPPGPAHRTAYATYLDPEVLLVTLDEFRQGSRDVVGTLDAQQLAWLGQVLVDARQRDVDWVIVQGHLPIVPNVRVTGSSAMCYEGGTSSALWRTLVANEVDLYLNGEVHNNTAHHVDGVTQISHGGIVGMALDSDNGNTSYLVGDIAGDRLELRLMRFRTVYVDRSARLWQTVRAGSPVIGKRVRSVPAQIGTMTLTKDQELLDRTGFLGPYTGPVACKTGG